MPIVEPSEETALSAATEAHHRIANNLSSLDSLMQMHSRRFSENPAPVSGNEVALVLDGIRAKLHAVAILNRRLIKTADDRLELEEYLRELIDGMGGALLASSRTVVTFSAGGKSRVPPGVALPIGLILCELITSRIANGRYAGAPEHIDIRCQSTPDQISLAIKGDGAAPPASADFVISGDLGLRIVRALVRQLNGTMVFGDTRLGLPALLTVPLPQPSASD